MNTYLKFKPLYAYCLLAMLNTQVFLFADNADSDTPNIKATWSLLLDQQHVDLSITNNGTTSIKIYPKLKVYLEGHNPYQQPFTYDEMAGVIYPMLKFTQPTARDNNGNVDFDMGGAVIAPVEVKPGETREFKFTIEGNVIKNVADSIEASFLLRFNSKEINKTIMKKKGAIWKE